MMKTTVAARTSTRLPDGLHFPLASCCLALLLLGGVAPGAGSAHAASPVTSYEYDDQGNLTKVTNGLGHASTYQYDALNRLIRQQQPHPGSSGQLGQINAQYNALDHILGITDPRNLGTSYGRNAFGQTLTLTSPDTGISTYTYDSAGNITSKTDARNKTITYTYDAANRLTAATGGPDYTYSYDAGTYDKGRLTGSTYDTGTASGSTAWSYNALGQVVRKQSIIDGSNYDLQMQYNASGQLTRIIYPSTHYIDYGYDTNGRINQIWVDGVSALSSIQYFPTGAVKSWAWGNGQPYTRSIDGDGRLTSYTVGDKLQILTYDDASRLIQLHRALTSTPGTPIGSSISTYGYDHLDRLTDNITTGSNQSYQYDLSGNRTQLTLDASNYPYTIDTDSNRLLEENGPVARQYDYDAAGSITSDGGDYGYTYDNAGRLQEIILPAATYVAVYNGLGQRAVLGQTRYVYDEAGHIIGEYDSSSDLIQETVYLGDTPVLTLRPSSEQLTADNNTTSGPATAAVSGSWSTASNLTGYYGSNFAIHSATGSTPDNVVYSFTPPASATYRIYARWAADAGNATNAAYTIAPNTSGSSPTVVTVDQTSNGGSWNYLGSYALNIANTLTVSLSGAGDGAIIADAIRIVPAATASVQSLTYNIYSDHLNTPREIRDHANQQRWTWYPEQAEAFGANLPDEAPASLGSFEYNVRFPGQLYHPLSQTTYNYFRDYDPRTGRYIQSDPIGLAGGINTYAYVDGNPLSYVDPFGLVPGGIRNMNQRRRDAERSSNTSSAAGVILCAVTHRGCIDSDLLMCVKWECTPQCGDSYTINTGEHSFTSPDTPCRCVRNIANPFFDKPLPGL